MLRPGVLAAIGFLLGSMLNSAEERAARAQTVYTQLMKRLRVRR